MNGIDKEILEHYRGIDFSLWEKIIDASWSKLHKLKTSKAKKVWALQLYSTYLQLIEVFCINTFAVVENELWENLFLNNSALRKKVTLCFYRTHQERQVYSDRFPNFLLENWVFGIKEKEKINNLPGKMRMYSLLLKEAIEDYLRDYNFLNAYKHGFRVKSHGETNLTAKIEGRDSKAFRLAAYNSSISYLRKQEGTIVQEDILFNWERVIQKASFLLNMMENIQKMLLSNGEEILLQTLAVENEAEFSKFFGSGRFRRPLVHKKTPITSDALQTNS